MDTSQAVTHNQIRLIKSETKTIDQALVNRFRSMDPSITERPLDETRVDYIALKVTEGSAVPFLWSYAKLKGKEYRVNGQHSSAALSTMNGSLPANLVAHIDEYEVKDEAELVHLFRQFDARKSGRSPMDVANAYASIIPGLQGIPVELLKLAAEGINWGRSTVERLSSKKADDRYEELTEPQNLDFLKWVGGLLSIKTPEMRVLPCVAAIYKTYFVDPEHADTFWSSVARGGDEFDDTDPATALDAWLRRVKENGASKMDIRPPHIYQACIFAWNASVDGKVVSKIVHDVKKGFADPRYPS